MSAYNTYNDLLQTIKDVSEDDSVEFADFIPKAIQAAELRITKDIDTVGLKQNVTLTTTSGQRTVFKPNGFRFIHDVYLVDPTTNQETRLKSMADDYLRDYWPSTVNTAKPKYFSQDYDKDNFLLAPTPDATYTLRLNIAADVTPISPTNQTNYFTDQCGETLFYATMVEMKRFAKDTEGTAFWDSAYTQSIAALNNQGRRARRDDGFGPYNPSGGQNTLKGQA